MRAHDGGRADGGPLGCVAVRAGRRNGDVNEWGDGREEREDDHDPGQ